MKDTRICLVLVILISLSLSYVIAADFSIAKGGSLDNETSVQISRENHSLITQKYFKTYILDNDEGLAQGINLAFTEERPEIPDEEPDNPDRDILSEVELDHYRLILDEIANDVGIQKSIIYLNYADFMLLTLGTANRIVVANNLGIGGEFNSEWNTFNSNLNKLGLSGLESGRMSLFLNELAYKEIAEAATSYMFDSAVIAVAISIGVSNPITGSIVGATYIVLMRPKISDIVHNSMMTAHLLSYEAVNSIENAIDTTNSELDKLYRIPEEDLVLFLMNYFSW